MVTQYDAAVISIYLPRPRGRSPETKTQNLRPVKDDRVLFENYAFCALMTDGDSFSRAFQIDLNEWVYRISEIFLCDNY